MMEKRSISRDDLLDVMEMTEKLERQINNILRGNERPLSMSALMSATINCMLSQCKYVEDVISYRDAFISILDGTIESIQPDEE